jgi:hypothetical protein
MGKVPKKQTIRNRSFDPPGRERVGDLEPRMRIDTVYVREIELVEDLIVLLPGFFGAHFLWSLKREVGVGRAIADIVVLLQETAPKASIEGLTLTESIVLSTLRQSGPSRIDLLETKCGLSRRSLREGELSRLMDAQMIQVSRGGRVALTDLCNIPSEIVAVEAKLSRWKDALGQAIQYRRYADRAYVALPMTRATCALDGIKEFERHGVGLLGVFRGSLITLIEARSATQHDWRRDFVYSRLLPRSSRSTCLPMTC